RRHRVPPPCRTAYDGAGRALPLWITSPQRFGCGQLFAIRTTMRNNDRLLKVASAVTPARGTGQGGPDGLSGVRIPAIRGAVTPDHAIWRSPPSLPRVRRPEVTGTVTAEASETDGTDGGPVRVARRVLGRRAGAGF